jgi:hypothetical protein
MVRAFAVNGKKAMVDSELRRIVKLKRADAAEPDRDLFDHLFRRSNASERARLASLVSDAKANIDWLNAIMKIGAQKERGRKS